MLSEEFLIVDCMKSLMLDKDHLCVVKRDCYIVNTDCGSTTEKLDLFPDFLWFDQDGLLD